MQRSPATGLDPPVDAAPDRVLVIPCGPSGSPGDGRFLRALSREGCAPTVVPSAPAALEALEREPCLLAFLELPARAEAGLRFLQRLRDRLPGLRAAVISETPRLETAVEALRLGAFDFLERPVTPAALRAVLRRARAGGDARQDMWLASLRALTPGLVHELRNPLSSVLASSQLLGRLVAPHDSARKYADIILEEARQLESFLARIAEFGRLDPCAGSAAAELPALLEEVRREAVSGGATGRVRVVSRCAPRTPPARANPARLAQACAELVRNALEAMPQGGTLAVTARAARPRGGGVEIEFADTGTGMGPEVRRRAFEPFFSTRPRALGLGLPLAQAIARLEGGSVRLGPPGAAGSRVVLALPEAGRA